MWALNQSTIYPDGMESNLQPIEIFRDYFQTNPTKNNSINSAREKERIGYYVTLDRNLLMSDHNED